MNSHKLLEKQVAMELRRRRLIFFTVVLLSFFYILGSFLFGESGFIRYLELKKRKDQIERDVRSIELKNSRMATELRSLKEDPFYLEKHAREDFGMARPDEYIFKYDQ